MTQLPRGLRNNNPGNIRISKDKWKGLRAEQTDGTFFQFIAPMWGYRALIRTLYNYHRLHGCRTIADYIKRWAPANENHTSGYISAVCREMQVPTTYEPDVNDQTTMCAFASAISLVENGIPAVKQDVLEGWKAL